MTNTVSGESKDISKPEWDEIRFGMFCTDEMSFAKYQKFIEDACAMTKKCHVKDVNKALKEIEKNIQNGTL